MEGLTPPIRWAQRKDRVFLTVELRDIKNEKVEWVSPSELKFSGTSDGKHYGCVVGLFSDCNIEESKWNVSGLHMVFNLKKKDVGYWKRLLKEDKKYNHIAVDWSKWVDEDEEEEDGSKGLGMDWNPDSMRGFGGPEGGEDEHAGHGHPGHDHDNCDSDSDDEEANAGKKIDDLEKEEDLITKEEIKKDLMEEEKEKNSIKNVCSSNK